MAVSCNFIPGTELEGMANAAEFCKVEFWEELEDDVELQGPVAEADNETHAAKILFGNADESDEEESNEEIVSDHETDSEMDWLPEDQIEFDASESENDVGTSERTESAWYGKDRTKWAKEAAEKSKENPHNKIRVKHQLKGSASNKPPSSPLEAWKILFTDDILELIVEHTNKKIEAVNQKYGTFRKRKKSQSKFAATFITTTDMIEIEAFIGLLFMQGIFKSGHEDLKSLWATDGTGRDIFRCTMSLARFLFLLSCLRFDNKESRQERVETDKLAPVSELFNSFVKNCQDNFIPGPHVTIDEMLVPFRGRCSFKMHMPSKPAKYGLKVQILVDSQTHYMINAEVYTGKILNKTEKKGLSIPTEVVLRMIKPIENSNRNITGDNWYTSMELVDELSKKGLTYVGTVRKNMIPPEFLPDRKRKVNSSIFAVTSQKTMVSYVPKKGKAVVLVSSMHHGETVDDKTKKPEVVMFYNSTKAGVEALDIKCAKYSTSRRTRRWPMAIFHCILNISGVNSRIIYQFSNNEEIPSYNFLKQLGIALCTPHMKQRITNNKVHFKQRTLAAEILGITMETNPNPMPVDQAKRRRCAICPAKKDRKTNSSCVVCKLPICLQCANKVCPNCI